MSELKEDLELITCSVWLIEQLAKSGDHVRVIRRASRIVELATKIQMDCIHNLIPSDCIHNLIPSEYPESEESETEALIDALTKACEAD